MRGIRREKEEEEVRIEAAQRYFLLFIWDTQMHRKGGNLFWPENL